MTQTGNHTMQTNIDPVWLASIVRSVIARLPSSKPAKTATHSRTVENSETTNESELADSFNEKLVTVATIEQLTASNQKQINIGLKTIVTPAAKDEAKRAGITITRGSVADRAQPNQTTTAKTTQSFGITDNQKPDRAAAVEAQLIRRSVPISREIVLSDTPAATVFNLCAANQCALMISRFSDVERFAKELTPDIWVLDMVQLNMTAAVNVAQRILQLSQQPSP